MVSMEWKEKKVAVYPSNKYRRSVRPSSSMALLGFLLGLFYHTFLSTAHYQPFSNLLSSEDSFRPRTTCKSSTDARSPGPIYFVDVLGDPCMTSRQACSLESAARANPQLDIIEFVNTESLADQDWNSRLLNKGTKRICDLKKKLQDVYQNLKFEKRHMRQMVSQSRFKFIMESGALNRSSWHNEHLRRVISWILSEETGGIYLESNMIVFTSLDCLFNTFVLSSDGVSSSVFSLEKNSPFSKFFVKYAVKVYQPEDLMAFGEPLLSSAIKMYCSKTHLEADVLTCYNNYVIELKASDSFFPLTYEEKHLLYQDRAEVTLRSKLQHSYAVNVFPTEWDEDISNGSLYANLMEQFCPVTFANTKLVD